MSASSVKPSLLLSLGARTLRARGGAFAMLQTLVAQGYTMAINLATGILTARLLGPSGRGEFAAAGLWLLLPSLLAVAGLQNGIVYTSRNALDRRAAITAVAFMLATLMYVPITIGFWVAMPSLMHGYGASEIWLGRMALLAGILNVWTVVVRQSMLGNKQFGTYNLLNSGASTIYLLLLLVLASIGLISPATAIYAQIVASGLIFTFAASQLVRGWRGLSLRLRGILQPLTAYSVRSAPIDFIAQLTNNVDRLILIPLVSPAEFGLYAVAISFARILLVLQTAISAVTLADLTGKSAAERQVFVHRTFRIMVMLLVVACGAVLLVDKPLLGLAYGGGFTRAVPIFRVLLLEAAMTCLGQLLMQAYLAAGRPIIGSGAQVASFVTTATGVFLLAPMFGSIGAAWALAGGSLVRLTVLLVRLPAIELARPNPLPQRADLALLMTRLRPASRPGL